MKLTYNKAEKLKSRKMIEQLFAEGKSVSVFPLRLVYLKRERVDDSQFKTGVSVGKRHFKKAVDRNRVKRLMREAYRLNKNDGFNNISEPYALMILYLGKTEPDFKSISEQMRILLDKFSKKTSHS